MSVKNALETVNLVKSYGDLRAVDAVSLELKQGEVFGLLGPNGAGKTSIISMVVTLERPTSGKVLVFGQDVTRKPRESKALIGLVPQELINHGYFNVEEILHFYSGYFGIRNNRDRIHFLMDRLQLLEHRHKRVKQLSGGMKRRLLIAKALLHRPKLLLLDEPTAGVDIELRSSLWDFVRELKREGMSILLTTHYIEEAEELCDRVGVLHQGQLLKVGQTHELIHDLTHRKVKFEMAGERAGLDTESPYFVERQGREFVFQIPSAMQLGELLVQLNLDLKQLKDISITEGSLEEAFRNVLKEA